MGQCLPCGSKKDPQKAKEKTKEKYQKKIEKIRNTELGKQELAGPEATGNYAVINSVMVPDNKDTYFTQEEIHYYNEKFNIILSKIKIRSDKEASDLSQKDLPIDGESGQTIRNWQSAEILGYGSFGRVVFGLNNETGELMAVKQVHWAGTSNQAVDDRVKALAVEIDVLSQLRHKNIVRYVGTSRDQDNLNIFLEYVAGGSIASLLKRYGNFNENLIRIYTKQILEGLEYLHAHNVIHRDIKGANVLVDENSCCKLSDFGTAKMICSGLDDNLSLQGTPNWMAPEVVKQTGHGRHADIWSVGCTVLEMATGRPPWSEFKNQITALFQIAQSAKTPTIPENLSEELEDFLTLCLQRYPKDRPNVKQLLRHPFIVGPEDDHDMTHYPGFGDDEHFGSSSSYTSYSSKKPMFGTTPGKFGSSSRFCAEDLAEAARESQIVLTSQSKATYQSLSHGGESEENTAMRQERIVEEVRRARDHGSIQTDSQNSRTQEGQTNLDDIVLGGKIAKTLTESDIEAEKRRSRKLYISRSNRQESSLEDSEDQTIQQIPSNKLGRDSSSVKDKADTEDIEIYEKRKNSGEDNESSSHEDENRASCGRGLASKRDFSVEDLDLTELCLANIDLNNQRFCAKGSSAPKLSRGNRQRSTGQLGPQFILEEDEGSSTSIDGGLSAIMEVSHFSNRNLLAYSDEEYGIETDSSISEIEEATENIPMGHFDSSRKHKGEYEILIKGSDLESQGSRLLATPGSGSQSAKKHGPNCTCNVANGGKAPMLVVGKKGRKSKVVFRKIDLFLNQELGDTNQRQKIMRNVKKNHRMGRKQLLSMIHEKKRSNGFVNGEEELGIDRSQSANYIDDYMMGDRQ
eukprot:CAMPEP_0115039414 /NCGR_PEP_ID=MMETSP0216-20121206/44013_1 /TAXON_ID=223996 /ORGANISM="Protocruzia adherens, Strain Boccale" /LENGTH=857 /DNA_ID=CAMNT_0002420047 /DNA_START=224 /DNA_END=2797 /DNA_ORIENTATION=+